MRTAIITAPRSLSDDTYKMLCGGIERACGEGFAFSRVEDDSILGGFILNIEGEVHDRSILSQLKLLRAHLSE